MGGKGSDATGNFAEKIQTTLVKIKKSVGDSVVLFDQGEHLDHIFVSQKSLYFLHEHRFVQFDPPGQLKKVDDLYSLPLVWLFTAVLALGFYVFDVLMCNGNKMKKMEWLTVL